MRQPYCAIRHLFPLRQSNAQFTYQSSWRRRDTRHISLSLVFLSVHHSSNYTYSHGYSHVNRSNYCYFYLLYQVDTIDGNTDTLSFSTLSRSVFIFCCTIMAPSLWRAVYLNHCVANSILFSPSQVSSTANDSQMSNVNQREGRTKVCRVELSWGQWADRHPDWRHSIRHASVWSWMASLGWHHQHQLWRVY